MNGDLPTTSGGDLLSVSGTNANFSPSAADAGSILVDAQTIAIASTEQVFFDGETGNGTLTVTTPAGATTTSLTSGATIDSGDIQVASLLAMSFENLGTTGSVVLDDADAVADDTLVYHGSGSDDSFSVSTTGIVSLNSQVNVDVDADVGASLSSSPLSARSARRWRCRRWW